ncbi:MAG: NUDIX domain-containing protein [Chloroflexi bacterium]|nr:NUDIX domain-containing protein [Chloroflexota bacterium]
MVGAAALIINQKEELLLLRRSDNDSWGIPGGAMEPGEILEETVKRETFEEAGLEIDDLALFGVFSGPDLFYEYPNGDQVYNVTVVYLVRNVNGQLQVDINEHSEAQFFALDSLPSRTSAPIKPILQRLTSTFHTQPRSPLDGQIFKNNVQ